jgi:membrane protease YdiL (CAAX protease family)
MNKNWAVSETFFGFAIYYLIFSLVDIFATKLNLSKDNIFLITSIIAVITLFVILFIQLSKGSGSNKKLETTSKNNSGDFLLGVISGIILGSIVLLGVFNDNNGIFSLFSVQYMRTILYPSGIINKILFFLVFVIALPIAEEMYFRGYMLPSLEKHYNLIIAAFITSILSSIFLSGSISFLLLFIAGLVFALLYKKTEAVFSGMVAHMTFNLIITLLIFIKGGN